MCSHIAGDDSSSDLHFSCGAKGIGANPSDAAPDLPRSPGNDDRVSWLRPRAPVAAPGCARNDRGWRWTRCSSGRVAPMAFRAIRVGGADRIEHRRDDCRWGPRSSQPAECISASGRQSNGSWRSCCNPAPTRRSRCGYCPRTTATSRPWFRAPARALATPSVSVVPRDPSCPIPRRDTSRRALTGHPRWSILPPQPGPIVAGAVRPRSSARCFTSCTSARSRRKGPGRPRSSSSPTWPNWASPYWRSCRSPSSTAASAGATTECSSSPRTTDTALPTTSAGSSTGATAWAWP